MADLPLIPQGKPQNVREHPDQNVHSKDHYWGDLSRENAGEGMHKGPSEDQQRSFRDSQDRKSSQEYAK